MSASFGDIVRRRREEAGLSQSRLAQLIGKSPTTVRSWEHGRTNPADPQAVAAIAAVLGLNESELLGQAGFEASPARARPSARQELTSLATERTELIALAPTLEAPERSKPIRPSSPEYDLVESPVIVETRVEPTPEIEITVEPVKIPIPIPPVEIPKPKVQIPKPKVQIPKPKAKMVVTRQAAPLVPQSGSNGFVAGRSYLENEAEKEFYRRRGVITAVVMVFMVIVIWWALNRTGGAIGDLIESIVGLLDI